MWYCILKYSESLVIRQSGRVKPKRLATKAAMGILGGAHEQDAPPRQKKRLPGRHLERRLALRSLCLCARRRDLLDVATSLRGG